MSTEPVALPAAIRKAIDREATLQAESMALDILAILAKAPDAPPFAKPTLLAYAERIAHLALSYGQQEAQGWQPIETAPKDRQALLWSSAWQRWLVSEWSDYCRYNAPKFTHWMPLPAAPPKDEA